VDLYSPSEASYLLTLQDLFQANTVTDTVKNICLR
jgi:hypothetical protein